MKILHAIAAWVKRYEIIQFLGLIIAIVVWALFLTRFFGGN